MRRLLFFIPLLTTAWAVLLPDAAPALGLIAAKGQAPRVLAVRAFLDWDAVAQRENLVVQARFEKATSGFAVVVPTPTKPEVGKAPRDFFRGLAVFTQLKQRVYPQSKLLPLKEPVEGDARRLRAFRPFDEETVETAAPEVIGADRIAAWLAENKVHVDAGDLDYYVVRKWFFTVARVDASALTKGTDGTASGVTAPLHLTFAAEEPVLPLRLLTANGKEPVEVAVTAQASTKLDLPGERSYQYQWVPLLLASRGGYAKGTLPGGAELPGKADDWLKAIEGQTPALLKKGQELGFPFVNRARQTPNKQGKTATTLEWAKRLTAADIAILNGKAPLGETVPDPDDGFSAADTRQAARADAIYRVIEKRLEKDRKERPGGYLVREAPAEDVRRLTELTPFLRAGSFVTRLRFVPSRAELADDARFVPATLGSTVDTSEYDEALPASP